LMVMIRDGKPVRSLLGKVEKWTPIKIKGGH
jgi:hypothetical protein